MTADPYTKKLLLNDVNDFMYTGSDFAVIGKWDRFPQIPDFRLSSFHFHVAAVVFNYKKNALGWMAYGLLLVFFTKNGLSLWCKFNKTFFENRHLYRFVDYLNYILVLIFAAFYLPYFVFKMRHMKKKWDIIDIYLHLYSPTEDVRRCYFDQLPTL